MLSQTEVKLKSMVDASKEEALLAQEKEAIRARVMHFMRQNPPRAKEPAVFMWFNLAGLAGARPALRYASLVAMVVLIGSGSVAFAARNAGPGDLLYPVKTGMSEKVRALTLFSDQAKAEYKINLAQLRLQETETAAAKDKLNDRTSAEVRMLFNDHITDIQNRIVAIGAKEDARVSLGLNSQLEALLKAHARIIDNLAEKKQGDRAAAIKSILSDVKGKRDEITKNRQQSEANVSLQASQNAGINAENKLQEAEAAVREAQAVILANSQNISEDARQKAEAELKLALANIVEGKNRLTVKDYNGAFILLQHSVRLAQEINIYISSQSNLKLRFNLPASLLAPALDIDNEQESDITDTNLGAKVEALIK